MSVSEYKILESIKELHDLDIKFSKNALKKLSLSNKKLFKKDFEQLKYGVKEAAGKCSLTSLIVIEDNAYIVSIENSVVITFLSNFRTTKKFIGDIDSIVLCGKK